MCRTGSKRQVRPRRQATGGAGAVPAEGASGLRRSPSTLSTASTSSYRPRSSPAGLYSYTGGMTLVVSAVKVADGIITLLSDFPHTFQSPLNKQDTQHALLPVDSQVVKCQVQVRDRTRLCNANDCWLHVALGNVELEGEDDHRHLLRL
ncbi:hypothetical protein EVAR_34186_1 [Eumeta japonica]|uniref:Uncharacterized protein n=1 Tax=Eumeta variegata TaxID=151549 RepID=A0A4C1WH21_EUMVA|nr:hypothetical protein EVAR_34186_1 [Eumeta japonica]